MADFAASFAGCGVGKSGSPAPKSTTSTPWRFNFAASPATFIVGDVDTLLIRSANMTFVPQTALDDFGDQTVHLAAERKHFFNQPRADVGILLGGHHEYGLDIGAETPV